jgi:hypothetical protein
MIEDEDIDHIFLGFNRRAFIQDIFEKEFNTNVRKCAMAMDMAPNYLRDLIYTPTRGAGNKTLSHIFRYCKKTGKNPELYIFIKK